MKPERENRGGATHAAPACGGLNALQSPDPFEIASQRLLLYLKALRVPVQKRYALADAAMSRAAALHVADGDIVAAAMRCLREVLREDPLLRPPADDDSVLAGDLATVADMPPMNRSSMIPVPLERTGPLKFLFLLCVRMLLAPLRPPMRIYVLALLCAALVAVYIWQRFGG